MHKIRLDVLNIILRNVDDLFVISHLGETDEDLIYSIHTKDGEMAKVEVFPENEGINLYWGE